VALVVLVLCNFHQDSLCTSGSDGVRSPYLCGYTSVFLNVSKGPPEPLAVAHEAYRFYLARPKAVGKSSTQRLP
jgi:hypothetical protein